MAGKTIEGLGEVLEQFTIQLDLMFVLMLMLMLIMVMMLAAMKRVFNGMQQGTALPDQQHKQQ